jgi:hypothetical protein
MEWVCILACYYGTLIKCEDDLAIERESMWYCLHFRDTTLGLLKRVGLHRLYECLDDCKLS